MNRTVFLPLMVVIVCALAVTSILQAIQISRLQGELKRIQHDIADIPKSGHERSSDADLEDPALRPALSRRLRNLEDRVRSVEDAPSSVGESRDSELSVGSPFPSDDQLTELVKKEVEDRLREERDRKKSKMLLSKLAEDIGADSASETRMADIFNKGKDELFLLLKTPRADGGNFVDDFLAAAVGDDRNALAGQVWMRLLTEKIAGTEETYFTRITVMSGDMAESIKGILPDDQWSAYESRQVDPHQVQTGYDPFRDYFASQGVDWPEEWD